MEAKDSHPTKSGVAGDSTIESLKGRTETEPSNVLVWIKLGEKLLGAGDTTGAKAALQHALTLNSTAAWAHYWLGNVLAKQNQVLEAEPHLRQAFGKIRSSIWPGYTLANILTGQERHAEACEVLQQTLAAQPGNSTILKALVQALAKCNRFDEAILEAKSLLDLFPADNDAAKLLRVLEEKQEDQLFSLPSCRGDQTRGDEHIREVVEREGEKLRKVKTIALYLPQFHPIPENDRWWGKGFTEWNNVVRGRPLFDGHYQPRTPADLGFYDLRLPETQQAQAELAEEFGIHGFCYYYYWFNGKKLLNTPIERMFHSGEPKLPFCVCWANENWSRNWDGQHRHILQEQHYTMDSNRALIQELIPMFRDARYIRHHGRPVFLVYRIQIIPDWMETARMWRDECRRSGIGEIHLCAVRFGLEPLEGAPSQFGLDAYIHLPPHETTRVDVRSQMKNLHPGFKGELFSYAAVVEGDLDRFKDGYSWPVHRGAMLGWDNTARRLTDARIFHGATPLLFHSWLKGILEQDDQFNSDDESLLFVMAWNEWAEGSYLEPDQKFGTRYLKAVRAALNPYVLDPPRIVTPASGALTEAAPAYTGSRNSPPFAAHSRKSYLNSNSRARRLNSPIWHRGESDPNTSSRTILLAAHISGRQIYGAERSFIDLLDALKDMPFNVIVSLPSGRNAQYLAEVTKRCVGAYVFSYPQWRANRDIDEWAVICFADIIARHNISLVHANTIVIPEPLIAAKRMKRISCVHARELITLDEGLCDQIGENAQDIIRKVFERADYVIANSIATERIFSRQDHTFYVPNAVHHREFDIANHVGKTLRVGIVSSNVPKKGIVDFIEVAKICSDRSLDAEFVVIGPENAQVKEWIKDMEAGQLPANLKFLGYRESPQQAMAELNVLLNLSSFGESFGRTVAEALASSRPVIAYEWGAIPEILKHGETGFLAPYRDVNRVAELVQQLCEEPAAIHEMGKRGRRFIAKNYSITKLHHHLARAYDTIFGESSQGQTAQKSSTISNPIAAFGEIPETTVVIPVYNAHDELEDCLESVIRHTSLARTKILIIDDGSTDTRIAALLNRYIGIHGFSIQKSERNLGYTKTINIGIREAGMNDVILLNSDTVVTPNWLEGLRSTAYSAPGIGTVTAMSDNAGAFSFPVRDEKNTRPDGISRDDYALMLVQGAAHCAPVDVPTGSGFCMFIRRALINEIGTFDEEAFPRGYGEENDFCMRALRNGWRNLVTPWSYVYHVRTASFGAERETLITAAVQVVTGRYPDYSDLVRKFFSSNEMTHLRSEIAFTCASLEEVAGSRC